MGKGNVCVRGEYEGLYYIDLSNFTDKYINEDGEEVINYDLQHEDIENSLEQFISDFTARFKSFYPCDKWISRTERAILENSLFYIVIEDNEWSIAVKLIQKEEDCASYNMTNLQAGLYRKYLEGIKNCLFNQFEELGVYGGAWTYGIIKRPKK
mgnify:CR=1 FL=1